MVNVSLQQIADTIGQWIPDVSGILHDYKAGYKMQSYSSSYNKQATVPHYQNNQNKDLPYSSSGNFQNNILYGSSGFKQPDTIKD